MILAPDLDTYVPISVGTASITRSAEQSNDPTYRLFAGAHQDFGVLALAPTMRKLEELRGWEDDWDGFRSARPSEASIDRAIAVLPDLYRAATQEGHAWINPHVTASESGEVVLEWWSVNHKITLYVGADTLHYMRVWGLDVERDMDDSELEIAGFNALWQWLDA